MRRLTSEQAAATRPDYTIWVNASAGTGKTFVLTARVLRLLLTGTPPERILCLTFTKAAAAEMSTRIYETLGNWTKLEKRKLAASIYAQTRERADDEMLIRARSLFAEVLDLPGGLKVQTIHSFCQSLLGRFPAEARLAPRFQVADERTAKELLDDSLERVLAAAGEKGNEALASALARVSVRVSEQSFSELMAAIASERGHFQRALRHYGGADGVAAETYKAFGVPAEGEELMGTLTADGTFDRPGLKRLAAALGEGTEQERERAKAIAAFVAPPAGKKRSAAFPALKGAFLTQEDAPRKRIANKPTLKRHPSLEAVIAAETERLVGAAQTLKLHEAAANSAAFTVLAAAVIDSYEQAKRRHGLLDYDDLILTADRLLQREGIAPWILYKLDGGIDHILVDEAQDTNPEQWRLLEELSREFYVGEGAREGVRSLFAVGDAKQSIFGFQRADPVEFQRAARRVGKRAAEAELEFRSLPLVQSFRSTAAVLSAVDAIFALPEARRDLTLENEPIAHAVHRLGHSGRVELWPSEPAEAEEASEDWSPPARQLADSSSASRLATKCARHIERLITGRDRLAARDRPVRPGDIMVLVRRRNEFVEHLVRALKALNIPVAGVDRMELTDQLAVMDLLAAAEFVLLPHDDLTLATVLKGPFIGFEEDELFALAHKRSGASLWQSLVARHDERPAFARAHKLLSNLLAEADRDAPFDFFSHLLNSLGARQALIARLGHEVNDPVDEFLNLTLEFERSHAVSLQRFVAWLGAGKTQIKRDMERGRNEVRVLTVHGAKGLQAPVVYVPDSCALPPDQERLLKVPAAKDESREPDLLVWPGPRAVETGLLSAAREALRREADAEYRRLFYVALTRAQDRLYIGGFETKSGVQPGSWYDLARRALGPLKEIAPTADPLLGKVLRLENPQETEPEKDGVADRKERTLPDLPDWARRKPNQETLPEPVIPSQPLAGDFATAAASGPAEAAGRRGAIVHKLLEHLPRLPPGAREEAARGYLGLGAHALESGEIDHIWTAVEEILANPDFGRIFGPGSRSEVTIAGGLAGRRLTGRIDRLVVDENEILVVDYKTSRAPPGRPEEVPAPHLRQLAAYEKVIGEIYPGRRVRAALLWTEIPRLMPIPHRLLAPHLEALAEGAPGTP